MDDVLKSIQICRTAGAIIGQAQLSRLHAANYRLHITHKLSNCVQGGACPTTAL